MNVQADAGTTRWVSGDDALQTLCFSDVVFHDRYDGWRVLTWRTNVWTIRLGRQR